MNCLRSISMAAAICLLSLASRGQSATPGRSHADSVQRSLLQDSLGVSVGTTTQFLALRDSNLVRSERIESNAALTPHQRNEQLQTMRRTIISAMRDLLGETLYNRYLELLGAQ